MGTEHLEERVVALEEELARLKTKVEAAVAPGPWWETIAGSFQNDPVYEKAMKLGRQYRESLRPGRPRRKNKK
jgi:hypothetical protein